MCPISDSQHGWDGCGDRGVHPARDGSVGRVQEAAHQRVGHLLHGRHHYRLLVRRRSVEATPGQAENLGHNLVIGALNLLPIWLLVHQPTHVGSLDAVRAWTVHLLYPLLFFRALGLACEFFFISRHIRALLHEKHG